MKESTAVTKHAKIVVEIFAKVQLNSNWRCIHLLRQLVRNTPVPIEIGNGITMNLISYCSWRWLVRPCEIWHLKIIACLFSILGVSTSSKANDYSTFTAQVPESKRGLWFLSAFVVRLSFVRSINLVPSVFPLSPAEKPCTSLLKIVEDGGADTSKSSPKFESCFHLLRQQIRNAPVHIEIGNDKAINLISYCSWRWLVLPA